VKRGVWSGLIGGAVVATVLHFVPRPWGGVLLFTLVALQLSRGAALVWARLRLPFASIAIAGGSLLSLIVVMAGLRGIDASDLLLHPLVIGAIAISVLLVHVDSRAHPVEWKRWRAHAQHPSLRDFLTGADIPDQPRYDA